MDLVPLLCLPTFLSLAIILMVFEHGGGAFLGWRRRVNKEAEKPLEYLERALAGCRRIELARAIERSENLRKRERSEAAAAEQQEFAARQPQLGCRGQIGDMRLRTSQYLPDDAAYRIDFGGGIGGI